MRGWLMPPCSLQLFLSLVADNIIAPLLRLVLLLQQSSLVAYIFFSPPPLFFKSSHSTQTYFSTNANGTLSQSSLRSSVCNDCSHQQWLYWICAWVCVFHYFNWMYWSVCVMCFFCFFYKLVGERRTNASVYAESERNTDNMLTLSTLSNAQALQHQPISHT